MDGTNRGLAVIVTRQDIESANRRFMWITDTDRDMDLRFIVGRVWTVGEFGNHHVILPDGTIVNCNKITQIYPEAFDFLRSWEEFELENNDHAYGGLLVPKGITNVMVKTSAEVVDGMVVVTEKGGEVADTHFKWVESEPSFQKEVQRYRTANKGKLKKFPFNMDWPTEGDPHGEIADDSDQRRT